MRQMTAKSTKKESSGNPLAPSAGFPPILGRHPRALVLGSLPSRKSLEKQQYYGHPQNAFWSVMGALFGASGSYPERCTALEESGLAVWDVLAQSVRPGSMDADIDAATAIANPLPDLVAANDSLVLVCFNGQKARQMFDRLVGADALGRDIELVTMPSTSPAYAAMSVREKTLRWQETLSRAFPALIDADLPLTRGE
jgi:hypoxanthine-DNA glycosylase